MGFLKKFFRNVFQDSEMPIGTSSFEHLTEEALESHLGVSRYGSFVLTDAVRPSYDLQVIPTQGFRHDSFQDEETKTSVPVLMGSVTKAELFDTFLDLINLLGPVVDVVLETSHHRDEAGHTDLYREHIDMPVLKSILYEFEDLLVNDGCLGIAVLNPGIPQEVQLDEHKLLLVYGEEQKAYEESMIGHDTYPDESIRFVTEAEHVHSSSEHYARQFDELKTRLGMDCDY
jgi:hypothetical protein